MSTDLAFVAVRGLAAITYIVRRPHLSPPAPLSAISGCGTPRRSLAASSGVRITGISKLTGTLDRPGRLEREEVRGFLLFIGRSPLCSREATGTAEEHARTERR